MVAVAVLVCQWAPVWWRWQAVVAAAVAAVVVVVAVLACGRGGRGRMVAVVMVNAVGAMTLGGMGVSSEVLCCVMLLGDEALLQCCFAIPCMCMSACALVPGPVQQVPLRALAVLRLLHKITPCSMQVDNAWLSE